MPDRLTQEELFRRAAAAVAYDPESGALTWLPKPGNSHGAKVWNPRLAGKEAGTITAKGYRKLQFEFAGDRKVYRVMAHRLAWFIVHGALPIGDVDHINRDRLDNRIENLRDVPASLNQRNAKLRRDNTSGISGVTWSARDKRWRAAVWVDGQMAYLGKYIDKEAANTVVQDFRRKNGFTEHHGKRNADDVR